MLYILAVGVAHFNNCKGILRYSHEKLSERWLTANSQDIKP